MMKRSGLILNQGLQLYDPKSGTSTDTTVHVILCAVHASTLVFDPDRLSLSQMYPITLA